MSLPEDPDSGMTSSKSYFIRAIYEWIVDNHCTPYIVLDATKESVYVPQQYVQDGKIILNVAANVVSNLVIQTDFLEFKARFSGIPSRIYSPISCVLAIYARENGRGMVFSSEDENIAGIKTDFPSKRAQGVVGPPLSLHTRKKPKLTVLKGEKKDK